MSAGGQGQLVEMVPSVVSVEASCLELDTRVVGGGGLGGLVGESMGGAI